MRQYILVRSLRKTMAIYITKEATVEVRAPFSVPKSRIDRFVQEKEGWIVTHLAQMEQRMAEQQRLTLTYGDAIFYRGKSCTIVAKPGNLVGFDPVATQFYLPPDRSAEEIQGALTLLYGHLAKEYIPQRVAYFSEIMGLKPNMVKINSAKTRWGSCSGRGNLNFSWMVMMASNEAIDYVVIHELAHLQEMNHSPNFWNLVGRYCPEYPLRKQELKALQQPFWGR